MLVLGIDFETTGLDPAVHAICEVGAQLWDTEHHRAVQSMSFIIQVPPDAVYEAAALGTTGLTLELIAKYGKESIRALKQILNLYDQADVICAHNGNSCDRPFLRAWMDTCGITQAEFPEDKLWIDTVSDIEYPRNWNKQLTCLAAYHGFLNPFPHQALSDVMTMLHILDRYPIDTVLENANTPMVALKLLKISYDNREWAKSHGYFPYWENGKFQFWMRVVKENKVEEIRKEAEEATYGVEQLDAIPEAH